MRWIVLLIGMFFWLWAIFLMSDGIYPIELFKILIGLAFIILSEDKKSEVKHGN